MLLRGLSDCEAIEQTKKGILSSSLNAVTMEEEERETEGLHVETVTKFLTGEMLHI